MTNFDPTSRCAILPSGETFDFVRPGMSKVVGRLREGVAVPESLCRAGLDRTSTGLEDKPRLLVITYIRGLFGAVVAGVSVKAGPTPLP